MYERKFAMKRLFAAADKFIQASDWKDIAILKVCLLSLGLLAWNADYGQA